MASWLGPPVEKYDYGTNGGSWTRKPAIIVLHSTEGTGWTNYGDGASAPHFTIEPKTGEIHQHVSLGYAARALKNTSGGVETNRGGAIQIEMIGTCDPKHRNDSKWNYLPDMDDATAGRIYALLKMISDACGIPLTTSVEFEPYPDPGYGSGYPRVSASTWNGYKGVMGHQHVPENDHGDPGNIPIALILGSGDDMSPAYVHVSVAEPVDLPGNSWRWVTWDSIGGGVGSASDKVCNAGSASIDIGGQQFVGTLLLGARLPTSATLETRAVLGDLSGDGGSFKIKSTMPPVVLRAGGDSYITDVRSAGIGDGLKLRYQVWASGAGELLRADLSLLYW